MLLTPVLLCRGRDSLVVLEKFHSILAMSLIICLLHGTILDTYFLRYTEVLSLKLQVKLLYLKLQVKLLLQVKRTIKDQKPTRRNSRNKGTGNWIQN